MMNQPSAAWQELMRPVPDWARDAKFGLFFHWGPYSVPAYQNEWYSRNMYAKGLPQNVHHTTEYGPLSQFGYKDFIPQFKGERFDAAAWAQLARRAGARYAGPVSEHADGFSLWDSQVNPINSVRCGPKRDVVGEMAQALRVEGLRFLATFHHQWLWGWFMSSDPEADVYDPANEVYYGPALPLETCRYHPHRLPDEAFCRVWEEKVREVVRAYGPDMVYFDSRAFIIGEKSRHRVMQEYYAGGPERIISYKQQDYPQGTGLYDTERGSFSGISEHPWQCDDRLEARVTWCHVQNARYRSAGDVVHQLCDIVSKNGNLLLGVGPKADGTFEEAAVQELDRIGDWLKLCGEAIYDTRPFLVYGEGPTAVRDGGFGAAGVEEQIRTGVEAAEKNAGFCAQDVRYTQKKDVLYAIVMGTPKGEVALHALGQKEWPEAHRVARVDLIGGRQGLAFETGETSLVVHCPQESPSRFANVLRLQLA